MVKIRILKQRTWRKRNTISFEKLEEVLETIPPTEYLKVEKKLIIFYNQNDPEVIRKRWIRKHKIYLEEHNYLRSQN